MFNFYITEEEEERSHPSQKVPTETRATSSILQDFHESSSRENQFGATDNSYHYKSDFELENQERRIIDNLGRGEEKVSARVETQGSDQCSRYDKDKVRAWKSMEQLQPKVGIVEIDLEERVSRDMESVLKGQKIPEIQSSHRFFDLEKEKVRMKNWAEQQEQKLKVPGSVLSTCFGLLSNLNYSLLVALYRIIA